MDYFLLFLRNNWVFIVEIGLLVISTLIVIFKKKAIITIPGSFISSLLKLIPGYIQEAEVAFGSGNGEKKLTYVIKKVLDLTCEHHQCPPFYVGLKECLQQRQ